MNEHEKMLAEGPRVAPEPPPAESGFEFEVPQPADEAESDFGFAAPKPDVETPTGIVPSTRRPQLSFLRLIPLAGFGLFFLADAAGYRRYAFVFLAAGFLIAMLLRTRSRKR